MCNEILEFDATPSWSGYNYQGKIALLVAIKNICEIYQKGEGDKVNKYSLELEWLEDFSIIYNGEYKSIHQVKALDTKRVGSYDEALLGLAKKITRDPQIDIAYLHTWKPIDIDINDWKATVTQLIVDTASSTELLNELQSIINDEDKLDKTTQHIIKHKKGRRPKCIKRIEFHLGTIITKETVRDSIIKEIKLIKEGNNRLMKEGIIDKIKLYKYSDDYNCELESIEDKIKVYIGKYYCIKDLTWIAQDANRIDRIYMYLLKLIDDNVIERHRNYSDQRKIPIKFSDIENIIVSNKLNENSKEYYVLKLKNSLYELKDIYCMRCSLVDCTTCKIDEVLTSIDLMDIHTFERFSRILCPEVEGELNSIEVFKAIFEKTGVNGSFFRGLREIERCYEFDDVAVCYRTNDRKMCYLTALADKGTDLDLEYSCVSIIKNKIIDSIFMDTDYLISKDLETESIFKSANSIMQVTETSDNGYENSDHILNCKKVGIIKVNDAIRRLIND